MPSKLTISAGSAVCEDAILHGTISVGTSSIVHPKCEILARAAPIVIGERTILEDRTVFENIAFDETKVMTIGNDNLFESGCTIRSTFIGNNNWFEPKAQTSIESVIGNNCTIGSGVIIGPGEIVPDNSIIVCVQDANGRPKRVVRNQKQYLTQAKENLTKKFLEAFLEAKSPYALARNHRLLAPGTIVKSSDVT
jgi:carbonic anhydrase/acetyltransferase-like protein (isoleucine patch superfamily)